MLKYWLFALAAPSFADNPVDCRYPEISGNWKFSLGSSKHDNTVSCSGFQPSKETESVIDVALTFPNLAYDGSGNRGNWTMIYNQGFEVTIGDQVFFSFSKFESLPNNYTLCFCGQTFNGWYHRTDGSDWGCYSARKTNEREANMVKVHSPPSDGPVSLATLKSKTTLEYVDSINSAQSSWVAGVYPESMMRAIDNSLIRGMDLRAAVPPFAHISDKLSGKTSFVGLDIPTSFDWRNVSGVNYVSPVRDQKKCGSCYAFASAAMLESRIRIATKNTMQPIISTQHPISCSEYSQGCKGGFVYLTAGKFGKDFGFVEEDCFPYEGVNGSCPLAFNGPACQRRYFTSDYYFLGGYYGASTEEVMVRELLTRGPFSAAFEVYPDFRQYKTGIYHHTGLVAARIFEPFDLTNHVVLVVGYGVDEASGEKYWIVKNSWAETFGEKGYFRIRRGTNEAAFESMTTGVIPRL